MEWTAQTIREVEFREKLRGYHPDDVDAFVEQVAAVFEQLQASVAAPPAAPVADAESAVSDDTIRKTLLMAQRTADLVLAEAEESAARLLGDARTEADALIAEASRLAGDLEAEGRERLAAEISELERSRAELQHDVEVLHRYADGQRQRMRELLAEQLRVLDQGEMPHEPMPSEAVLSEASPSEPSVMAVEPEGTEHHEHKTEPEVEADEGAVVDVDVFSRSVHLPAEGEDDPFLAELRRAIDDPSNVGPAQGDHGDPADTRADGEDFEIRRPAAADVDRTADARVYDAPGPEGNRLGGRLFRRR